MKLTSRKGGTGDWQQADLLWISDQKLIQPLSVWSHAKLAARYAYSPSAESCSQGEPGQDFAAVASDGRSARFVLCDGVSLSYRGDYGARILGEELFAWLKRVPEADLESKISRLLTAISRKADKGLDKLKLPEGLSPLVRDVLLEKRQLGTEAMFACGYIAMPSRGRKGKLWLMWQGDIRIRFWNGRGEALLLPPEQFNTLDRWSSRPAKAGTAPYCYSRPLSAEENGGLLIYSDGLESLDDKVIPLPGRELERALAAEASGGLPDDGSLLELNWNEIAGK